MSSLRTTTNSLPLEVSKRDVGVCVHIQFNWVHPSPS